MDFVYPLLIQIKHLSNQGGAPLWPIMVVAFIIFFLTSERLFYMVVTFPAQLEKWLDSWRARRDHHSWHAMRIREAILAETQVQLDRSMWLLKACIVACPLLGLTGTVSGMILVFDQISFTGTGNPRLMSSGIFQATIPTMAGMLTAIIGMILRHSLLRLSRHRQDRLTKALSITD